MPEPFLIYLTVFKARLGLANLLLDLSGFVHQPPEALQRKIKQVIERRNPLRVDDPANSAIFEYLNDKSLVSASARARGRYQGLTLKRVDGGWEARSARTGPIDEFPAFLVDVWMAEPWLRSTVGAPTPDNVGEVVELGYQLQLVSRAKNTWTRGGHLIHQLRAITKEVRGADDNPLCLGLEQPALLRQVAAVDGPMLRELLREIQAVGSPFKRDDIAHRFDVVVDRAVAAAREVKTSQVELRKIREFAHQVSETLKGRDKMSRGPGMLEHRVAPRLEWLTDLGYLSKAGLQKNGFEYRAENGARDLLDLLDQWHGDAACADRVAAAEWHRNPAWAELQSGFAVVEGSQALIDAYRMLRRPVGPVPLRELAFLASLMSRDATGFSEQFEQAIEFAQSTEGASLSGGRYTRSPENIHMTDKVLNP